MSDERPANWSPKFGDRRRIWEQDPELAAELARLRALAAGLPPPTHTAKRPVKPHAPRKGSPAKRGGEPAPLTGEVRPVADIDELTPAERIDAARGTVRSLTLLLQAVDAGDVVATPLEVARIQGAIEALRAMVGSAAGEES